MWPAASFVGHHPGVLVLELVKQRAPPARTGRLQFPWSRPHALSRPRGPRGGTPSSYPADHARPRGTASGRSWGAAADPALAVSAASTACTADKMHGVDLVIERETR